MQRLATPEQAAQWLRARVPQGTLVADSRQLRPGDGFVAWPGLAVDARRFVAGALAGGAAACLVEAEGAEACGLPADARVAAYAGLKAATGAIAHGFFGRPSERLAVVASTGTNGKTSTAWWTAQALCALGRPAGLIGTLGVGEPPSSRGPGHLRDTGLTTPDPVTLHATLARFAGDGLAACAMEASSIGLAEHRLDGCAIDVALFTNLTQDHLDYHGTMQAYGAAKRRLFEWPGLKAAVVNVDDAFGVQLADELRGGGIDLWTVSLHGTARLVAGERRYGPEGLVFEVTEGDEHRRLATGVVGEFNASNLLVVLGGLRALGVPLAEAVAALGSLTPVPGRLQRVAAEGEAVEAVVDYAHTPDALQQVLAALRPLAAARGGRLLCVFGCGGDRDATKRPLMGAIASRLADRVVVTSDNPRSEDPAGIVAQVLAGAGENAQGVVDRREAIARAVREAAPGDVLLVAGKGHETTQVVAGVAHPFSDADEVRAALAQRRSAA
ncbi:MAG: UDP-N-acetylmuramoyl-L-alanyl-D-glutamate--2,6-diaminopimelate ligase [Betaproteobacteria bacterium]|jgi:UDP-N-acetylmuramyl-tripeptide synthetase|nr:UDP-N-acetylmuramoyl-L-alanyl-D-glutamate--2,6-diaminopimelate ligase [Rubrivivax sp.]